MKYVLLITMLLIISFSSEAQHDSINKDYEKLTKYSGKLEKLKFSEASRLFGEPNEIIKRKITSEMLPLYLSDSLINKHFPKHMSNFKNSYLMEVNWSFFSVSWISVWYKLEKNDWVPLRVLVTI